jgi:hypothetical protein
MSNTSKVRVPKDDDENKNEDDSSQNQLKALEEKAKKPGDDKSSDELVCNVVVELCVCVSSHCWFLQLDDI